MIRVLMPRGTCVLLLLAGAAVAQPLLDTLSLRVETPADHSDTRLAEIVPADLIEKIESGSAELRHLLMYDAPARQLRVRTFIAHALTTPTSLVDVGENEYETYWVDVLDINLDEASRTLTVEGIVAEPIPHPVAGGIPGDRFQLTIQYDPGARTFSRTRINVGSARVISYNGTGFLQVEETPNLPPVANAGPELIEATTTEVALSALESIDPDGDALDFKWHVLGGVAALRGCETATPVFQLVQGPGIYDVRVIVTDARGAASYAYVRIRYGGR